MLSDLSVNRSDCIATGDCVSSPVQHVLQHSIGSEATWSDTSWPPGWGMWTRNTSRTRVFFRPMSVSPFLSSMSAFLSFRIPTQSILANKRQTNWPSVCDSSGHVVLANHCSPFSLFVAINADRVWGCQQGHSGSENHYYYILLTWATWPNDTRGYLVHIHSTLMSI